MVAYVGFLAFLELPRNTAHFVPGLSPNTALCPIRWEESPVLPYPYFQAEAFIDVFVPDSLAHMKGEPRVFPEPLFESI